MRRIPAIACGLALLTGVAACSDNDEGPTVYSPAPQPVRTMETPLPDHPARLGEIVYSVLGIRTGILAVVGSHADWLPKGQYVRLRLAMVNNGRERHNFDSLAQLLIAGDGKSYKVSYDAMQIDRQPVGRLSVGRGERREFDLWFDIPKTTKARTLRIIGDPMSSGLADQLRGSPSPGTKTTVDISLP